MKNYLFVVRQFNDIDHFTPLVDYFCRAEDVQVHLYTSTRTLLRMKNENLDYLKNKYNLSLKFLMSFIPLSLPYKIIRYIMEMLSVFDSDKMLPIKVQSLVRRGIVITYRILSKKYESYGGKWAEQLLESVKPSLVVFDWQNPNAYTSRPLILEAKKRGIPVISIPHGLNVFATSDYSDVAMDKVKKQVQSNREQGIQFDYVVSQGPISTMHLLAEGNNQSEIVELGSARFAREWIANYRNVFKKCVLPLDIYKSGKIKVVIFLSKQKYNQIISNLKDFLTDLASEKDIQLVVKPHTRGMKVGYLKDILSKHNVYVSYAASSYELSQWCDMAVVWGSSIGLQVLNDKKLLIYPTFIDTNQSIYEKYSSACIVKNFQDMKNLIEQYKRGEKTSCYGQENVNNLFRDAVYAGDLNRNVIKDYVDFFNKISI